LAQFEDFRARVPPILWGKPLKVANGGTWVQSSGFGSTFQGVEMTAELIAQLATLFLILGAGPIIVVFLYARGGNL
jgi:hypothetical protein